MHSVSSRKHPIVTTRNRLGLDCLPCTRVVATGDPGPGCAKVCTLHIALKVFALMVLSAIGCGLASTRAGAGTQVHAFNRTKKSSQISSKRLATFITTKCLEKLQAPGQDGEERTPSRHATFATPEKGTGHLCLQRDVARKCADPACCNHIVTKKLGPNSLTI